MCEPSLLTTCKNRVQFHSRGLGIATNKMADGRQVSAAVIVALFAREERGKESGRSLGKGMAETENRKRGFHTVVRKAKSGGTWKTRRVIVDTCS